MFENVFSHSILARAQKNNTIQINLINLREFGIGTHKTVDDKPFGGGTGMILRVDVVEKAIQKAKTQTHKLEKTILLEPTGKPFVQKIAEDYSKLDHLILVCGHYECIDARIKEFVDDTISLGDFVLTGGEIPAMAITDAVARLIPDVISKNEATQIESFSKIENKRLLEYPQYTRPQEYKGAKVPDILLSGDHNKIKEYRNIKSKEVTKKNRPDLL